MGRLFAMVLLSWLIWALATPWVIWLGRIVPPTGWRSIRTWFIHVLACVTIAALYAIWISYLQKSLQPFGAHKWNPPFKALWLSYFVSRFHLSLLIYVAILAISHTIDARERLILQEAKAAALSAELAKAELDALRRQLEPHFLFNTLNSIAGLLRQQRTDFALTTVVRLGDLLRRVLDSSDQRLVSLGEEIDFLETYLSIQALRFGERLRVEVEVPSEIRSAQIPSLIVQPLVENAIHHGVAQKTTSALVRISAHRNDGSVTILVWNDGPELGARGRPNSTGLGLANVSARLYRLYGQNCSLNIRNGQHGGVEACIVLPYEPLLDACER